MTAQEHRLADVHPRCHIRPCRHTTRRCRDSSAARWGPAATSSTRRRRRRSPVAPSQAPPRPPTAPAASAAGAADGAGDSLEHQT